MQRSSDKPSSRSDWGQPVASIHHSGSNRLVERECEACDWKGQLSETRGLECPRCRAATRTVASADDGDVEDAHEKESHKNPHATALGRLGGLKGGRARADRLSAAKRTAIARKAARARWRKHKA